MMKLSIIIPCYNAEPYINDLLKVLDKQVTADVEVIVIDDGSAKPFNTDYKWCKVIRQTNGGASAARNTGLDNANGEYIAFIDADDLIAEDYVSSLLAKITAKPDYIFLSWKTLPGGWKQEVLLKTVKDEFPPFNLCVWNRVYRRDLIGDVRFNVKKLIAEDAEFIRQVETKGKKKAYVGHYVYFYRSNTPNSLTKRFHNGQLDTKRVVYYFNRVKADMTYLIDEFKQADKDAEVILLTNQNDIPELQKYAMVMKPCTIRATERRGEPNAYVEVMKMPKKTQVVIWTLKTFEIGGIETFIYNFCKNMHKHYDITVLYGEMAITQIQRLRPFVEVLKNDKNTPISCDTLIVNRISDEIPQNITAKKTVQMVHTTKMYDYFKVPQGRDYTVAVSNTVANSFDLKNATIIPNMLDTDKPRKTLLLISASRLDQEDKGVKRMIKLANLMNKQDISFLWIVFSNRDLPNTAPANMIRCLPNLEIVDYMQKADYLIQLSDAEAFCYSIFESLSVGTPIICTPLEVIDEFNLQKFCKIVPFEIPNDFDTTQFLDIPQVDFKYSNDDIVEMWRDVLGDTKPQGTYKPDEVVFVKVEQRYKDITLDRFVNKGEIIEVTKARADYLKSKNLVREV